MRFEYVIVMQEGQGQAAAEARAAAAEARAEAQEAAQRIREEVQQEVQRIRDEAQQVRVEVQQPGGGGIHIPPPPPRWERNAIPPQIVDLMTMLAIATVICIVGLPIARAFGRWIDRRGLPSPVNAELAAQMNRIEQAVDTMSVEVERISEAQRFQAKLLSDREKVRA